MPLAEPFTPWPWDIDLMLKLNFDGGPVMDFLMYWISDIPIWIPFYLVLIWMIWRRFGWKQALAFVACALIMLFFVETVSTFFKQNLSKFRPTHYLPLEELLHTVKGYKGGLYGTVSAHAGNTLGFTILTSLIIRRRWFTIMMACWCLAVSYSRIYLGMHYPADIMFGFINGAIWGALAWLLYRFVTGKIARRSAVRADERSQTRP